MTSEMDVQRLRDALASLAGTGGGTTDAERIFDALHGNLSDEERRAVVNELVTNAEAAEAWRLARELTPEPIVSAASPQFWRWMSLAAGLLLAVGLAWPLLLGRSGAPPPYRSGEPARVASAIPEDATLSRTEPILRWIGPDGARYRVRVLTPDLALLAESDALTATEYAISAQVLQQVAARGLILWHVEAQLPGGVTVTSPTFSVRIE